MKLDELISEIDTQVAQALTTADPAKKIECIELALTAACQFIRGVSRGLRRALNELNSTASFASDTQSLSIRDLAVSHEELEVFSSPLLFSDFLDSTVDLLVEQQFLSKKRITELFGQFKDNFESITDFKLDHDALDEIIEMLKSFYCRPPDGGPGGILNPLAPDSGGDTEENSKSALDILEQLAGIGAFILEVVGTFWPHLFSGEVKSRNTDLPTPFSILAFACLSGLTRNIAVTFGAESMIDKPTFAPSVATVGA